WQHRLQKRQVFADELLLQADCVRGNDDLVVFARRDRLNCGYEVCERLPHSCSRFNEEFPLAVEGISDSLGHVELLRARLEAGKLPGNQPFRAKNFACVHAGIVAELLRSGKAGCQGQLAVCSEQWAERQKQRAVSSLLTAHCTLPTNRSPEPCTPIVMWCG